MYGQGEALGTWITIDREFCRENREPEQPALLVAARTPSAAAADALNLLVLAELLLWYAADAGAVEVGLFRLDAA